VGQLGTLIASDRRGEAVELFQTKALGMPANVVAQLRQAPFWPALEAEYRSLSGQTHAINPEVLAPVVEEFFKR
jgi:hypothetical protein